jgi:hypothetical protein
MNSARMLQKSAHQQGVFPARSDDICKMKTRHFITSQRAEDYRCVARIGGWRKKLNFQTIPFPLIYTLIGASGIEMGLRESLLAMETAVDVRSMVWSETVSFPAQACGHGREKINPLPLKMIHPHKFCAEPASCIAIRVRSSKGRPSFPRSSAPVSFRRSSPRDLGGYEFWPNNCESSERD